MHRGLADNTYTEVSSPPLLYGKPFSFLFFSCAAWTLRGHESLVGGSVLACDVTDVQAHLVEKRRGAGIRYVTLFIVIASGRQPSAWIR